MITTTIAMASLLSTFSEQDSHLFQINLKNSTHIESISTMNLEIQSEGVPVSIKSKIFGLFSLTPQQDGNVQFKFQTKHQYDSVKMMGETVAPTTDSAAEVAPINGEIKSNGELLLKMGEYEEIDNPARMMQLDSTFQGIAFPNHEIKPGDSYKMPLLESNEFVIAANQVGAESVANYRYLFNQTKNGIPYAHLQKTVQLKFEVDDPDTGEKAKITFSLNSTFIVDRNTNFVRYSEGFGSLHIEGDETKVAMKITSKQFSQQVESKTK